MIKPYSLTQKTITLTSIALILVGLISIPTLVNYETDRVTDIAYKKIRQLAELQTSKIENEFNLVIEKSNSHAIYFQNAIEVQNISRNHADEILKNIVADDSHLFSAWITFPYNTFDGNDSIYKNTVRYGKSGAYSCWWHQLRSPKPILERLDNFETETWHMNIAAGKSTVVLDPYEYRMDNGDTIIYITIGTPIRLKNKTIGYAGVEFDTKHIAKIISNTAEFEDYYVSLISSAGIYAYNPIASLNGKTANSDIINNIKTSTNKNKGNENILKSRYLNKDVYDIYLPIKIRSIEKPWYIRISLPTEFASQQIEAYRNRLLMIVGLGIITCILIVYFVIFFSIRPISLITKNLQTLAIEGTDQVKAINVSSKDEIGILCNSYNQLIDSLLEKKKIEKEKENLTQTLKNSEENLRITLHSIGDAIIATDDKRKITRMNPIAEQLTGWMLDEAKGKDIDEVFVIIHAQTRKPQPNPIDLVLETGKTQELANHTVIISKNGDERHIADAAAPIRNDNKEILGVILNFRDVTENYANRRNIEQKQQDLQNIFDNAPFIMMLVNKGGSIEKINNTGAQVTGFKPNDVIGLMGGKVFNCIHEVNGQLGCQNENECRFCDISNAVEETYALGINIEKRPGELTIVNKNKPFTMSLLISTVHIKFDNKKLVLLSIDNVTTQKQQEKELLIAKEKAEESDRLKSAFLSNMSHEIRTPINSILGFIDLISLSDLSQDERITYSKIMIKSSHRLLNTINNIIDISKIESGQISTSYKNVHLNEIIKELYTFYIQETNKKGLTLSMSLASSNKSIIIFTDEAKFHTIFSNLINNAIKYTIDGGVSFGYEVKDNYIECFVKDSGIGISNQFKDSIFNRFEQIDSKDATPTEGSGLGLTIAKAYVDILGGKIWVKNNTDQGVKFIFTIPINQYELIHNTQKDT